MKNKTKKKKIKYTTDYDFWLKHKDEYIYINKQANYYNKKIK